MIGPASVLALAVATASLATAAGLCEDVRYENKTRAFIMTDISNEPDDQMSLVRLLTHSNELDIVNIAVVTSTWKNDSLDLSTTFAVINAYGEVVENLNSNVPLAGAYPPADEVSGKVVAGHPVYGLAALQEPTPSNASTALITAVDASDQPLWVLAWGGANVLAEALNIVKTSRSEADVSAFVDKLRVYSISDQDDSGPWIRTNFPRLFYIVSIHGFSEYGSATWIVGPFFPQSSPTPKCEAKDIHRVFRAKPSAISTKAARIAVSSPTTGSRPTSASAHSARTTTRSGCSKWKETHLPSLASFQTVSTRPSTPNGAAGAGATSPPTHLAIRECIATCWIGPSARTTTHSSASMLVSGAGDRRSSTTLLRAWAGL